MRNLFFLLLSLTLFACKEAAFKPEWTKEKAPLTFTARFETTKGDFEIEIQRKNSPLAADRLYQLVKHHYYDNTMFYRVVPEYVAQFGKLDTVVRKQWDSIKIPDEPVRYSNKRGTITFARLSKASRGLELFINMADNTDLDTLNFQGVKGFPALGHVTKGMETVDQLYAEYGETTMADPDLYLHPDLFYQKYPKLDLIKKAYLID